MRNGFRIYGRRASILCGEGPAERAAAVSNVSRRQASRALRGHGSGNAPGRLRPVWGEHDRSLPASPRPPGVLLELLRSGASPQLIEPRLGRELSRPRADKRTVGPYVPERAASSPPQAGCWLFSLARLLRNGL